VRKTGEKLIVITLFVKEGVEMTGWVAYIPYAVIVFGLLVLFHELGHFALAKVTGVQVYEFSIGFGPRLAGFRRGDTVYNLRAVPLGGFVRMAGMDPEEDLREAGRKSPESPEVEAEEADKTVISPEKSFMHKSVPKRMAIIAAGPLMNFVLAILLFSASFLIFGLPTNKNIVGKVIQGLPAAEVGIKPGDVITKINDTPTGTWLEITDIIHKNPERVIKIEVKREGQTKIFTVKPVKDPEEQWGKIGITYMSERLGLWKSLKLGVIKTYEVLKITVYFIGKMIAQEMPVQLSGPVRITYELGKAAELGIVFLINIAGFLSIQIGLFNLLPIPALDGSRLLFLGLEGIRGTPIEPSKENFIHLVGLALLLLLMVVITYQDIIQMLS